MSEDTTAIVLAVLQEVKGDTRGTREEVGKLRDEVTNWHISDLKKLATLERQMVEILGNGNGKQGRLAAVERLGASLKLKLVWAVGIGTGVSGLCAFVGWVFRWLPIGTLKKLFS